MHPIQSNATESRWHVRVIRSQYSSDAHWLSYVQDAPINADAGDMLHTKTKIAKNRIILRNIFITSPLMLHRIENLPPVMQAGNTKILPTQWL